MFRDLREIRISLELQNFSLTYRLTESQNAPHEGVRRLLEAVKRYNAGVRELQTEEMCDQVIALGIAKTLHQLFVDDGATLRVLAIRARSFVKMLDNQEFIVSGRAALMVEKRFSRALAQFPPTPLVVHHVPHP